MLKVMFYKKYTGTLTIIIYSLLRWYSSILLLSWILLYSTVKLGLYIVI